MAFIFPVMIIPRTTFSQVEYPISEISNSIINRGNDNYDLHVW